MTFQELKTAYLHLDYEDFTNKILINLKSPPKSKIISDGGKRPIIKIIALTIKKTR